MTPSDLNGTTIFSVLVEIWRIEVVQFLVVQEVVVK